MPTNGRPSMSPQRLLLDVMAGSRACIPRLCAGSRARSSYPPPKVMRRMTPKTLQTSVYVVRSIDHDRGRFRWILPPGGSGRPASAPRAPGYRTRRQRLRRCAHSTEFPQLGDPGSGVPEAGVPALNPARVQREQAQEIELRGGDPGAGGSEEGGCRRGAQRLGTPTSAKLGKWLAGAKDGLQARPLRGWRSTAAVPRG